MAELNGSVSNVGTNHTTCNLKAVEIAIYSIFMTLSLVGNVLVVAVYYRNKTLRTAVHYFIVNMAISDLIIPVVILPEFISYVYHDDVWLADGVLGTVLCKLVMIAWKVSILVSLFSMMTIAIDRFHGILFPMKSTLFSRNKCRLIIAATWVVSVAFWAHEFYEAELVTDETGLHCDSSTEKVQRINWIMFSSLTFVGAVVFTVLYCSIITFLYRQKNNLHLANEVVQMRARENRQAACMLVIIVVVFYVVWVPYHVAYFLYFLLNSTRRLPCYVTLLIDKLPFLHSVVNPVVYYVFNENYRKGFRDLLCCPWPCINKCNDCFQPRESHLSKRTGFRNADNVMESIELREQ